MKRIPILFLGDSPDLPSGLARIGRDLASRLCQDPRFEVGYLGLGGLGVKSFGFRSFTIQPGSQGDLWGSKSLPQVWKAFAGNRRGVIMSIWDPIRVSFLSLPHHFAKLNQGLNDLIDRGAFQRWGYFAIDASGPGGSLDGLIADSIVGYERKLLYNRWALDLARRSGIAGDLDWLPHGIDEVWQPQNKSLGRKFLKVPDDSLLLGAVATNNPRKDWGLVFAAVALLRSQLRDVVLWIHTDVHRKPEAYDFDALINDFGLKGRVFFTSVMRDDQMALAYSACDVILSVGSEGYGYSNVESLACGVPVAGVNYAGTGQLLPKEMLIDPVAWRFEGLTNAVRPVCSPAELADKVLELAEMDKTQLPALVEHLRWGRLWKIWAKWFEKGLEGEWGR